MKNLPVIAVVIASGLAILGLSGCSGGGTESNGKGPITYLVPQPDTPAQLKAIKSDIKTFEKKSGVRVNVKAMPSDTIRTVLQTQLRSGAGPDVFQYDTGPGFGGVLARAGLLYDLTGQYAKSKYTIWPWARQSATYDGKTYGLPDQAEEVGLFYNADLLKEHGLAVPNSLTDFESVAASLKKDGVTPIALNDQEGWQGYILFSMALSSRIGAKAEKGLVAGKGSWDNPDVAAAMRIWKTYVDKGWTPSAPTAVNEPNGDALFYSGKAAFAATGTWLIQTIEQSTHFKVGFMPFPSENGKGVTCADLGSGVFVSKTTKDPQASLKLVDYLASQEHGRWELTQSQLPAFPVSTDGISASPLFKKAISDLSAYTSGEGGGVAQDLGVDTTDIFNKAMSDGMQGVLNGSLKPEQAAKNLQQAAKAKK